MARSWIGENKATRADMPDLHSKTHPFHFFRGGSYERDFPGSIDLLLIDRLHKKC